MLNFISGNNNNAALKLKQKSTSERNENTFAVIAVVESVSRAKTEAEACKAALETVRQAFGWAYGSYWCLDSNINALRFKVDSGTVNPEFQHITQNATFSEGVGLSGRAWQAKELVFVEDLDAMPGFLRHESAKKAGIKSGICFPIFADGKIVGTMDFFSLETLHPSEEQLDVLKSVGRIVSEAFERIYHETLQIQKEEDSRAISEILEKISETSNESDAIKIALDTILYAFGWAYGSYWVVDPEINALRFAFDSGTVTPEFQAVTKTASFKEGVGLSGKTWKLKELVFVEDLGTVTDCCRRESAQRAGVKSGVCFPILVDGKIVGTIDFFSTETLSPNENRLNALRSVGRLVSSSLERIQKYEKEKETSRQIKQSAIELEEFSEELKRTGTTIFETAELSTNQAQEAALKSNDASQSAQSLSGSIKEMSSCVQEISRNAQQATQVTQNAEVKAEESKKMMDALGRSAHEINSVVDLIKDIASQTNLLALNATIEAASAGDAGKGFAVVANEVKALAKQSADATDNIRTKVETIQQNTQEAIQVIEVIAQTIMEINAIICTIASAVEEQSATTSEINHEVTGTVEATNTISINIVQLVKMSQETATSAASLQALNSKLDNLKRLINNI